MRRGARRWRRTGGRSSTGWRGAIRSWRGGEKGRGDLAPWQVSLARAADHARRRDAEGGLVAGAAGLFTTQDPLLGRLGVRTGLHGKTSLGWSLHERCTIAN